MSKIIFSITNDKKTNPLEKIKKTSLYNWLFGENRWEAGGKKKKIQNLIVSAECSIEMSLVGQNTNLPSISMSIIRDELPFKLEEEKNK